MFSSNTSQVSSAANYIEDVFSTYLYTGDGAARTITNNIDLSTKGGMVWIKERTNIFGGGHNIFDTARGGGNVIETQSTQAQQTDSTRLSGFTTSGFTLGGGSGQTNGASGQTYASWTFREQAKFFDVVTWTGDGTSNRQISHSLGSTPGCVIVKNTGSTSDWPVYHRSLGFSTGGAPYNGLRLNGTNATGTYDPPISAASSTTITVTTSGSNTNQNGQTFVAYLFAHDAGGFGLTGTDNVISCGSFVDSASTPGTFVNLGWEPQFVLYKRATGGISNWNVMDTMRGFSTTTDGVTGSASILRPDSSLAESTGGGYGFPTSTGFYTGSWYGGSTWIYIAIRRGPMKTPTSGTSVFSPIARAGTSSASSVTGLGFSPDTMLIKNRLGSANSVDWSFNFFDRLRNPAYRMSTAFTVAEDTSLTFITSINMDGITFNSPGYTATNGSYNYINYFFKRAPGFFDTVCYTGSGNAQTISHNLGTAPQVMICRRRSGSGSWYVYHAGMGANKYVLLNSTGAQATDTTIWNNTAPTASVFSLAGVTANSVGDSYIAYLFGSTPGVIKCGVYTGDGTASQTINCGFTSGARLVILRNYSAGGSWYVADTARGIVSGNDPYILLDSTDAEDSYGALNWIAPASSGFAVTNAGDFNYAANSYLYIAIS